jgi:hypothetical protein
MSESHGFPELRRLCALEVVDLLARGEARALAAATLLERASGIAEVLQIAPRPAGRVDAAP